MKEKLRLSVTCVGTHSEPAAKPMTPKGRAKVESHIQAAVAMVLDELGLLWFHPANELAGFIGPGHLGQIIAQGMKAGVSDCIIIETPPAMPSVRFLALELKAPGGRVGLDQKRFLEAVNERSGCFGEVVTGLQPALDWIARMGWDVASALGALQARGYTVEGERMVRAPKRPARVRGSGRG